MPRARSLCSAVCSLAPRPAPPRPLPPPAGPGNGFSATWRPTRGIYMGEKIVAPRCANIFRGLGGRGRRGRVAAAGRQAVLRAGYGEEIGKIVQGGGAMAGPWRSIPRPFRGCLSPQCSAVQLLGSGRCCATAPRQADAHINSTIFRVDSPFIIFKFAPHLSRRPAASAFRRWQRATPAMTSRGGGEVGGPRHPPPGAQPLLASPATRVEAIAARHTRHAAPIKGGRRCSAVAWPAWPRFWTHPYRRAASGDCWWTGGGELSTTCSCAPPRWASRGATAGPHRGAVQTASSWAGKGRGGFVAHRHPRPTPPHPARMCCVDGVE